ncbi:hypothetical protein [Nguyenibacter sp. L1]|uniref:hypothetical protein n=1 Tax=Nguyenibacter sp. L1 TaxID=3049350 RepID=UPI002B472BFA|nr:hypothetical protein [Nguyenibacter sp. L1]WRH88759.1 hypothetical protein QN315_03805 [Nguyenibacter sp. L1]
MIGCAPSIATGTTPWPPPLRNSDGDEIALHDIRFPLAKGVTQKTVAARLDTVSGLRSESRTF